MEYAILLSQPDPCILAYAAPVPYQSINTSIYNVHIHTFNVCHSQLQYVCYYFLP